MKVRHKGNGMVVAVPEHLQTWTPDRVQPNPALVALGKHQSTPWFQWAQWEEVDKDTPITHPVPPDAKAEAKPDLKPDAKTK